MVGMHRCLAQFGGDCGGERADRIQRAGWNLDGMAGGHQHRHRFPHRPADPEQNLDGGVRHHESPAGRVHLRSDNGGWWGWGWHGFDWRVGLTREVPLALRIDVGAARSDLDLSDLKVTDFVLKTGASETMVRLPKAAGLTKVHVESGAASVKLTVPEGVAARIRSTMGLGASNIDQRRFPRNGEYYQSPDYDSAANKIDIQSEGGVGSVSVN